MKWPFTYQNNHYYISCRNKELDNYTDYANFLAKGNFNEEESETFL